VPNPSFTDLSNLLNSVERLEVGLAVTFDVLEEAGSKFWGHAGELKLPATSGAIGRAFHRLPVMT